MNGGGETTVRDRWKEAREGAGWTQHALARLVDMVPDTIQRIEQGVTKEPRALLIYRFMRALRAAGRPAHTLAWWLGLDNDD